MHNNDYSSSDALTEVEFALWRKKGVIGKAHNHAVRFSRSTQKNGYWMNMGGKKLPRDNGTRWTSIYKLVSVLDDPNVQKALQKLYSRHPDAIEPLDRLTSKDFQEVHKIRFLQAMYDAILFTEGHSATLDRVLPAMEFVLEHFETGKDSYSEDRFLSPCINSGWSKLNDYYALTDKSPAYVAAVVLDPSKKWQYFEDQWKVAHPEWLNTWKVNVERLWESSYKVLSSPDFIFYTKNNC